MNVLLLQELGALSLAASECARLGRRYLDCLPESFRHAGDRGWSMRERESEEHVDIFSYFFHFYETTFRRAVGIVDPSIGRLDFKLAQAVRLLKKVGRGVGYLHANRHPDMITESVSAMAGAGALLGDDLARSFPGKAPADAQVLARLIRDIPADPHETRRRLMNLWDVLERFDPGRALGWPDVLNNADSCPPLDLGEIAEAGAGPDDSPEGPRPEPLDGLANGDRARESGRRPDGPEGPGVAAPAPDNEGEKRSAPEIKTGTGVPPVAARPKARRIAIPDDDIVRAIGQAGRPLFRSEIKAALEAQPGISIAESTLNKQLPQMVKEGLLQRTGTGRGSKGYDIPKQSAHENFIMLF